jgi:hypothetical protein
MRMNSPISLGLAALLCGCPIISEDLANQETLLEAGRGPTWANLVTETGEPTPKEPLGGERSKYVRNRLGGDAVAFHGQTTFRPGA